MDLTATILAASGATADSRLEGIDLLPILEGRAASVTRTLFWRIAIPVRQQRAVRAGEWKLLVDGDDTLLFDLSRDIAERNDVAKERPDIAKRLRPLIAAWEKDVDSEARAVEKQGPSN
jgi:arylsulfatase A-like enzyme